MPLMSFTPLAPDRQEPDRPRGVTKSQTGPRAELIREWVDRCFRRRATYASSMVERLEDLEPDKPPGIHIVQNWYEEFRDREQDYGMHP